MDRTEFNLDRAITGIWHTPFVDPSVARVAERRLRLLKGAYKMRIISGDEAEEGMNRVFFSIVFTFGKKGAESYIRKYRIHTIEDVSKVTVTSHG